MTTYQLKRTRKGALKTISLSGLADWWLEYFTTGGIRNVTVAYSASVWAFRCIQLRAQTIANIPVRILNRATDQPMTEHPLVNVFSDVGSDLLARLEFAMMIWGVNYLEITRARLGNARGLNWLNPGAVSPLQTGGKYTSYHYTPINGGTPQVFLASDIVHIFSFNPNDDLNGLSPLGVALTDVGVDQKISQYAEAFFTNGARIEGILNVPGASEEQVDAIEAKWKAIFRGVAQWFKTLIMGAQGVTYTPLAYPPDDLALEVLSAETRRSICAAFGVPPILAGAWEAANLATAKEQRESFYTETILPELDIIEDELNRKFVHIYYPRVSMAFDTSQINALREDELTRNQALTTGVSGGWMTVNEARARAGLPPVEGGDILLPAPGTAPVSADGVYEVAPPSGFFPGNQGVNYP